MTTARTRRLRPTRWSIASLAWAAVAAVGCAPDARWIAVTGDGTGRIVTVAADGTSDTLLVAADSATPNQVQFGRDGWSLFVLSAADPPSILRTRRPDGRVLASFGLLDVAQLFVLDGKGRRAFVARGSILEIVQLADGTRSRTLTVCSRRAAALVPFEATSRMFVICTDDVVAEIDTRLQTVLRTTPIDDPHAPCDPAGASMSDNGALLFVSCAASKQILYLDRVTLVTLTRLTLGEPGGRLVVSGGRGIALAAEQLLLLDLRRRAVTAAVRLPAAGRDLAVTADGRLLILAADEREARLLVYDLTASTLVELVRFDSPMRSLTSWPEATPVFNW